MKTIRIPLLVMSIVLVSLMAAFVLAAFGDGVDDSAHSASVVGLRSGANRAALPAGRSALPPPLACRGTPDLAS